MNWKKMQDTLQAKNRKLVAEVRSGRLTAIEAAKKYKVSRARVYQVLLIYPDKKAA